MKALYGCVEETNCCGLQSLGQLSLLDTEDRSWDTTIKDRLYKGTAYFATTVPREREVIKALKRLGFKSRLKWRNARTTNTVTLWTYVPGQRRKTKTRRKK